LLTRLGSAKASMQRWARRICRSSSRPCFFAQTPTRAPGQRGWGTGISRNWRPALSSSAPLPLRLYRRSGGRPRRSLEPGALGFTWGAEVGEQRRRRLEAIRLRFGPAGRPSLAQDSHPVSGWLKPTNKRMRCKGVGKARLAAASGEAQLPGPPGKGSANDWHRRMHQHRPDRRGPRCSPSVTDRRFGRGANAPGRTPPQKRSRFVTEARAGRTRPGSIGSRITLRSAMGWRSWSFAHQ